MASAIHIPLSKGEVSLFSLTADVSSGAFIDSPATEYSQTDSFPGSVSACVAPLTMVASASHEPEPMSSRRQASAPKTPRRPRTDRSMRQGQETAPAPSVTDQGPSPLLAKPGLFERWGLASGSDAKFSAPPPKTPPRPPIPSTRPRTNRQVRSPSHIPSASVSRALDFFTFPSAPTTEDDSMELDADAEADTSLDAGSNKGPPPLRKKKSGVKRMTGEGERLRTPGRSRHCHSKPIYSPPRQPLPPLPSVRLALSDKSNFAALPVPVISAHPVTPGRAVQGKNSTKAVAVAQVSSSAALPFPQPTNSGQKATIKGAHCTSRHPKSPQTIRSPRSTTPYIRQALKPQPSPGEKQATRRPTARQRLLSIFRGSNTTAKTQDDGPNEKDAAPPVPPLRLLPPPPEIRLPTASVIAEQAGLPRTPKTTERSGGAKVTSTEPWGDMLIPSPCRPAPSAHSSAALSLYSTYASSSCSSVSLPLSPAPKAAANEDAHLLTPRPWPGSPLKRALDSLISDSSASTSLQSTPLRQAPSPRSPRRPAPSPSPLRRAHLFAGTTAATLRSPTGSTSPRVARQRQALRREESRVLRNRARLGALSKLEGTGLGAEMIMGRGAAMTRGDGRNWMGATAATPKGEKRKLQLRPLWLLGQGQGKSRDPAALHPTPNTVRTQHDDALALLKKGLDHLAIRDVGEDRSEVGREVGRQVPILASRPTPSQAMERGSTRPLTIKKGAGMDLTKLTPMTGATEGLRRAEALRQLAKARCVDRPTPGRLLDGMLVMAEGGTPLKGRLGSGSAVEMLGDVAGAGHDLDDGDGDDDETMPTPTSVRRRLAAFAQ